MIGWHLTLDPAARRTDGGRVLVGGSPLRILRLSAAGARWLDDVAAGEPVPAGTTSQRLARRLVDAGLAHPVPPRIGADLADVAVVIPVRDRREALQRTLASLGPIGEVVVVDDGSESPVADAAEGASLLRRPTPGGPGAARQDGWRSVDRPIVAFVDADVELPPGWLRPLVAHLEDPAVGAVAPRVASRPAGAPRWLAAYEAARSSLDLGPDPAPVRPGSHVPYVPTAALVVRRAALEDVGGFDVDLRVGEDVDLVWRLHRAGWAVRYEPSVVVHHPCRPTLGSWLTQRFTYGTSAAALAARHGRAVAPLGISGWSALAWGAVVAGRPTTGIAIGAGTTAALVPKLRSLDDPVREALRIAGTGHLWAGRSVADALRRAWWPLTAVLAWRHRRARPAVAAAAVVPSMLEWRDRRPGLDPVRYIALRLVDDVAYGAGLWFGAIRARSLRALLPRFSGPIDPPDPA